MNYNRKSALQSIADTVIKMICDSHQVSMSNNYYQGTWTAEPAVSTLHLLPQKVGTQRSGGEELRGVKQVMQTITTIFDLHEPRCTLCFYSHPS